MTGDAINGVVYYEPQLVNIRYEFTALVGENGKVIGTAEDGKCKRVIQKEEITIHPNFNEPRVLIYDPSWFASGKFGVTLSNGMLTAINTESTPLINEFLGQVAKFKEVGILKVAPEEPRNACNTSPVVTSIRKQVVPWPN